MTVEGIDYAWAHPSPAALGAAGKRFACRYLSFDPAKNLTAAEARQLHAAGIATVSNWEATAGAAKLGFGQGVVAATAALLQHRAAGGPDDRPIYFSADFDVPDYAPRSADPAAKLGPVGEYFRGVASVIGLARTGAYGGYWAISRLFDAGLIRWGWQTFAWSGGRWDARAHIQQYSNGVTVGGADCDLNRATVADYGQWPISSQGDDMALSDVVPGTGTPANGNKPRSVEAILHDAALQRAVWIGELKPDAAGYGPSTPLGQLVALAAAGPAGPAAVDLTDAQLDQLADKVVARLGALVFKAQPAVGA